jgi:hypothetical protein
MAGIECRVSCAHALLNLIEQGHLLSGWSARLELSLVYSCPSGCCSHQSSKSRSDISERATFVRSAFAATKTKRVIKARTDFFRHSQ